MGGDHERPTDDAYRLVHFHDWRAARDRKAATRYLWCSRCIGLVAVPVSMGLATLVLAVGTSSFCSRQLKVARKFGTGC